MAESPHREDRQYLVYGSAWFSGRVEAGSPEEARFHIISELLNDAGISIKIEFAEVEEDEVSDCSKTDGLD